MNDKELSKKIQDYIKLQNRFDKKFKKHFGNNILTYIPIILILVIIPFCFFENTKDIGLNLVSEMIGVAVTVFIIDKAYERKEKKARIVIDKRIFLILKSIIASYFSIWKHLNWEYLPEHSIKSIGDLIGIQKKILQKAKIDDKFNLVKHQTPESWSLVYIGKDVAECFSMNYTYLNKAIPEFINEYRLYIDPILYDILYQLLENEYNQNIGKFTNMDQAKKIASLFNHKTEEDLKYLECYLNEHNSTHFSLAQQLIDYSKKFLEDISKLENADVSEYNISEYFILPSHP